MSTTRKPERGTRPANRRDLIIDAATDLFAERGYEHVSIGAVAEAVAVGPSALYRHFKGKEQMLTAVIETAAEAFTAAVEAAPPGSAVPTAAAFSLDHRAFGVLWEREARHLPPAEYERVRARTRAAHLTYIAAAGGVPGESSAVAASASMSVLLSPSFHRTSLPRPEFDDHLVVLAERALATPLEPAPEPTHTAAGLRRSSTRGGLTAAAIDLFAHRTYASTTMDDVAAAVGLKASSLYNHLPGKTDLLLGALTRADGYLQLTLDRTLAEAADERAALTALCDAYIAFAVANPALVTLVITEVRNLPEASAQILQQDQREFVGEMVHLLRLVHPGLDEARARVGVNAVLMTINDLARSPNAAKIVEPAAALRVLARRILDL
ncbi:TetR/AcrR family transcriptional regulator [Tsukamurella ocularis]|uniref:TetR/AcrR family transcriptional regulator n=1 Tax=Tsukamurella ocularis TaxID=1970234 RepID=UPI0039F0DEF6